MAGQRRLRSGTGGPPKDLLAERAGPWRRSGGPGSAGLRPAGRRILRRRTSLPHKAIPTHGGAPRQSSVFKHRPMLVSPTQNPLGFTWIHLEPRAANGEHARPGRSFRRLAGNTSSRSERPRGGAAEVRVARFSEAVVEVLVAAGAFRASRRAGRRILRRRTSLPRGASRPLGGAVGV